MDVKSFCRIRCLFLFRRGSWRCLLHADMEITCLVRALTVFHFTCSSPDLCSYTHSYVPHFFTFPARNFSCCVFHAHSCLRVGQLTRLLYASRSYPFPFFVNSLCHCTQLVLNHLLPTPQHRFLNGLIQYLQ